MMDRKMQFSLIKEIDPLPLAFSKHFTLSLTLGDSDRYKTYNKPRSPDWIVPVLL